MDYEHEFLVGLFRRPLLGYAAKWSEHVKGNRFIVDITMKNGSKYQVTIEHAANDNEEKGK